MDRQRGGSRNKGTGEKKIELDARRIESKIHFVEKNWIRSIRKEVYSVISAKRYGQKV